MNFNILVKKHDEEGELKEAEKFGNGGLALELKVGTLCLLLVTLSTIHIS